MKEVQFVLLALFSILSCTERFMMKNAYAQNMKHEPLVLVDGKTGEVTFSPEAKNLPLRLYVRMGCVEKCPGLDGRFVIDFQKNEILVPPEVKAAFEQEPDYSVDNCRYSRDGRVFACVTQRGEGYLWLWENGTFRRKELGEVSIKNTFMGLHWSADASAAMLALFNEYGLYYDRKKDTLIPTGGALLERGVVGITPLSRNRVLDTYRGVRILDLNGKVLEDLHIRLQYPMLNDVLPGEDIFLCSTLDSVGIGSLKGKTYSEVFRPHLNEIAVVNVAFTGYGRSFTYAGRLGFPLGMIGYFDPETEENRILLTSTRTNEISIYDYSAYSVP